MAKLKITRPNGDVEYAELTTDASLAGNDRLKVVKDGTTYYAKLSGVFNNTSTHMYVIKDGKKRFVQKEAAFKWKWTFNGQDTANILSLAIPRSGVYSFKYIDGVEGPHYGSYSSRHEKALTLKKGDKPVDIGYNTMELGGFQISYSIIENLGDEGEDVKYRTPLTLEYLHA